MMNHKINNFEDFHKLITTINSGWDNFSIISANRIIWKPNYTLSAENINSLLLYKTKNDGIEKIYVDNQNLDHMIDDLETTLNQNIGKTIKYELIFGVTENYFISFDDAKKKIATTEKKINEFYILKDKLFISPSNPSEKWNDFLIQIQEIKDLLSNYSKISHYSEKEKAIYVDSSENINSSFAMTTDATKLFKEIPELINFTSRSTKKISILIEDILKDNINFEKERAVFRATIFEIFKNCPNKSDPSQIAYYYITNQDELYSLFEKNYQAFVSGLSLEKLKTELAECQIKLSEQATKGLMDISGKMFALPAIALIPKLFNKNTESIDLFSTLTIILTCIILISALIIQINQLKTIENSSSIAFDDFDKKIPTIKNDELGESLKKIRNQLKTTIKITRFVLYFFIIISCIPFLYLIYQNNTETVLKTINYITNLPSIINELIINIYHDFLKKPPNS